MKKITKVFLIIGVVMMVFFVVPLLTIFVAWNGEIRSVSSIKLVSDEVVENKAGPVYEMTVHGDYYFDDFVEQGGMSNDNDLSDFIVGKITKGLVDIELAAPEIGCAGFTVETEEGNRLFGRSYDFGPGASTSMIVTTNPGNGRYSSVSSVDLGFLSVGNGTYMSGIMDEIICMAAAYVPLDGINEKGLSVGILMTYQGDETVATDQNFSDRDDYTSTTMLRYMLDYCATIEEAIDFAKSINLHDSAGTSFHYMIADATGASAVLEWVTPNANDLTDNDGSTRVLNVVRNDDDINGPSNCETNDFQYATNFILTPGYYDNYTTDAPGYNRYLTLEQKINPNGTNTEGIVEDFDSGIDILKSVARRTYDGGDDNNGLTIWSALYDLTDLKMRWVGNEYFDDNSFIFDYQFNAKSNRFELV
ncbi:MAG: C45 family peptidase [bacterium]